MTSVDLKANYRKSLFDKIKYAHDTQNLAKLVVLCEEYLVLDKNNAWVLAYFAFALSHIGGTKNRQLASAYIQRAVKLLPNEATFIELLGRLRRDNGEIFNSLEYFQEAIRLNKDFMAAYHGAGIAYIALGELEKGIDLILHAVRHENNPKYLEDLNQYVYYDPRFKNADYKKIAELFYNSCKDGITPFTYDKSRYDANKEKLKIGFYCAEPLGTPTWLFLEKIFQRIDRDKFALHCFARPPQHLVRFETKEIKRVRSFVDQWEYCQDKSIKETVDFIHEQELDILIDLSGYLPSSFGYYSTEPNIMVFMHKPAPVQITWYGFWGTTGIKEIDYLMTVKDNVPETQDENFTEKVYRLNTGFTHSEIFHDLPTPLSEPPCIQNGYITFTSFSRLIKLNSLTYDTWSEILRKVPNSKFLFKYVLLDREHTRERIFLNFESRGITRDRILIEDRHEPAKKFISAYNTVDIALEPIPFGGVTTTINALTMGVPVIAKYEEDRVISGSSYGLLKIIGASDLCATSDEEYVNNAVNLAGDIERLKSYRTTLPSKMLNCSINADGYTKVLEKAFTDIWQDCCKNFTPSEQTHIPEPQ